MYLKCLYKFQNDADKIKSGYLKTQKDPENSVSLLFSLPEKVGALAQVLKIFEVGMFTYLIIKMNSVDVNCHVSSS